MQTMAANLTVPKQDRNCHNTTSSSLTEEADTSIYLSFFLFLLLFKILHIIIYFFENRFQFVSYFVVIFIAISLLTRITLLLLTYDQVDMQIMEIIKVFAIGLFYDLVAVSYYLIPFIVYLIVIPNKVFNASIHKTIAMIIYFAVIFGVIFNGFSEYFFWEEFGKRFNFIAVDYLVYTHEVIHNILESYPIPLLVSVIFLITSSLFYVILKKTSFYEEVCSGTTVFSKRLKIGAVYLSIPLLFFILLDKQTLTQSSPNKFNQELEKNGFYSLFSAFRHNELDYDEFYKTMDEKKVFVHLRQLLKHENTTFKSDDIYDITEVVHQEKEAKKYNIILVMVESLSAEYMGIYGDKRGLTPHLDTLAKKSIFFNNFFATGTRTVRGMEAVVLSLPPTPGRSIVKRPDCENSNSAGFIFKELGYENKFIYAGHGYFDNMNYFFSNNGFEVVDRLAFKEDEITFANVWGVCDEDLFNKTMKEADRSYTNKKPFFSFVMTTSNHRPYTYPEGKIDIPSHTGRDGGVKYTDYAIDQFLKDASKKPWFDDTIFVVVADHNGGSAGKTSLPIWRYKIPFFIYAPKIVHAGTVSKLASQVDLMPTLMGVLGQTYDVKSYGDDILSKDHHARAFVGNYQKLGLYHDNTVTVLSPDKSVKDYIIEKQTLYNVKYKEKEASKEEIEDIVTYYQSASYLYKDKLLGYPN